MVPIGLDGKGTESTHFIIALAFGACLGDAVPSSVHRSLSLRVAQTHGHHIGFVYWMKVGVPTVILCGYCEPHDGWACLVAKFFILH